MKEIEQYLPKNTQVKQYDNLIVFEVVVSEIQKVANDLYQTGDFALKMITATDERDENGCFKVWYVFGRRKKNMFVVPFIQLKNTEEFPSLAAIVPGAESYERKINAFFGLRTTGHNNRGPFILHENWPSNLFPLRKDFDWRIRPEKAFNKYSFQKIGGEGIYEIPVGPIHAGIIEPGHFRFSVAGEEIVLLEPKLGFTHKGSEKLFEQLPLAGKISLSERISGDSSFSHSMAFCQAAESLGGITVPKRALYLRVVYAELERLANHFGDIGAIMLDTGFNFGGAHGARLRETIMQMNELLTGSRFLRGVNMVGGVMKDIDNEEKIKIAHDLFEISRDFSEVVEIAENSASLLNRIEDTGVLSCEIAKEFGVLGVAARAAGIPDDTRVDFPYAAYGELGFNKAETHEGGDVQARFWVRIKEARAAIEIIQRALLNLPDGLISVATPRIIFKKNSIAVSSVEGWRGEIIYFLVTDSRGNIARVYPRDPSFINWVALGSAGQGNVVPDFPLINKSFNLSYSGNDL